MDSFCSIHLLGFVTTLVQQVDKKTLMKKLKKLADNETVSQATIEHK